MGVVRETVGFLVKLGLWIFVVGLVVGVVIGFRMGIVWQPFEVPHG